MSGIDALIARNSLLQKRMDVNANGMANGATAGYQDQKLLFRQMMNAQGDAMVGDSQTIRDLTPGPLMQTDNPFDMAIQGPGYFGFLQADGSTLYGRAGKFTLDNQRQLVNFLGQAVVADGGALVVPPTAVEIDIKADGSVLADGVTIGKISLYEFDNPQLMDATGNGMLKTAQAPLEAVQSHLLQGSFEGSNVNEILLMVDVTEITNEYRRNNKMIEELHQQALKAIQVNQVA